MISSWWITRRIHTSRRPSRYEVSRQERRPRRDISDLLASGATLSRRGRRSYGCCNTMKVSIIAAMDRNGVIGKDGKLPWRLPADLQFFKRTTMGKPVIMGRVTWDSLGKPLPGRRNNVISRRELDLPEGAECCSGLKAALAASNEPEAMIIGGASIYEQALPLADRLYLTQIDTEVEGDAWFPAYDADDWVEVARESHEPDEKNPFRYAFVTLDRRR